MGSSLANATVRFHTNWPSSCPIILLTEKYRNKQTKPNPKLKDPRIVSIILCILNCYSSNVI